VQPSSSWNLFDADVLRWILERKFSLSLLRQFSELRIAIEPAAARLAAQTASVEGIAGIVTGFGRMQAAESGAEEPLEADIAFHIAILEASANPFFVQFRDVVATALRTSIRFTNRFNGRTASLPAHHAVLTAIEAREPQSAYDAMSTIISDVMVLITEAEQAA
jgi:DNA-binding FadR family transcriptional regulator